MKTLTITLTTLLIIVFSATSCATVEEQKQKQETYREIVGVRHRSVDEITVLARSVSLPNVRYIGDPRGNRIIIQGPEKPLIEDAVKLIEELDVPLRDEPELEIQTRYLPVKNASVRSVKNAIRSLSERMATTRGKGGSRQRLPNLIIVEDERNRQIIISALLTAEEWGKVEDIISHMDIPNQDVSLNLKIVLASEEAEEGTKLPKELKPASKQLKKMFDYESYEVANDANFRGTVSGKFKMEQPNLNIRGNIHKMDGEVIGLYIEINKKFVKIDSSSPATSPQSMYFKFEDNIQIKSGETLIIGGSKIPELNKDVLLVLFAKAVDPYK